MSGPPVGVVLMNIGTPQAPTTPEVRRYLREFLMDPRVIDIPTWRVLMILGEESPRSMGQVAKSAVINLSTMMRIAERMTKAGLVATAENPSDRRNTDLLLTDSGASKLAAARAITAPIYQRLIRGFSATDFSRLLALLNRLHDNLE